MLKSIYYTMGLSYFLLILIAAPVHSATYYVDFVGGADRNNGTSTGTPFKHSPGDSACSNTCATQTLSAGDTVIFKGGVSYTGTVNIKWSGTPGNNITYDGNTAGTFGTGKAVFDQQNKNRWAFYNASNGKNYIVIDNFEIKNVAYNSRDYLGAAIYFAGKTTYGPTIQNCTVHDLGRWQNTYTNTEIDYTGGIYVASASNCTIQNNRIYNAGFYGVRLYGTNNCLVYDNTINYAVWGIDVSSIPGSAARANIIRGNTIYDLYVYDCPYFTGWKTSCVNEAPHTDFIFFRQGAQDRNYPLPIDNIAEQNLMYNNIDFSANGNWGGTAMLYCSYCDRTIWRNNVLINPHSIIAASAGSSANVQILNNTIYFPNRGSASIAIALGTAPGINGNFTVKNNLVHARFGLSWISAESEVGWDIDYNYFTSGGASYVKGYGAASYMSLAQFKKYTSNAQAQLAVENTLANIKFLDTTGYPKLSGTMNLNIATDSLAKDAGATITGFSNDKNGISRPQGAAWDIGAYENKQPEPPLLLRIKDK